jgi:M6 family metalloprotease-like protein
MRKFFVSLLGLLAFLPMAFAAYFVNVPQMRVQPNGDTLRCFATGDEYFHRLHDADGYTIVLDPATGYYVYADKVGDKLVPTAYVAGRTNPAEVGLSAGLSISAEQWMARRQRWEEPARSRAGVRDNNEINHGHMNNLVVFIRFADENNFVNSFNSVNAMFNDSTPGNVSLYNFFQSATYNQLAITSTFYPQPSGTTILSYQDIYSRGHYEPYSVYNTDGYDPDDDNDRTGREHQLLARAVNYIANMVPSDLGIDYDDDGYVDNVVFVVRGNVGDWNDLLWPHRWALYSESAYINGKRVWDFNLQLADATSYFNTAVLCHEMNHSLGAPDLYHYYEGTDRAPVGYWDLMETTMNPPQHMGAYMKYKYGHWIDEIPEITECGTYSLHSLGSSATNNCYKIASPNPSEYFVLEYRNKNDNFESSLPSSGLLIYRVNTSFNGNSMWNGVDIFDELYLYRPGGSFSSEGDTWYAAFSANTGRTEMNENTNPQPFLTDGTVLQLADFTIRNISYSGGDSMTFTFCDVEYLQATPENLILESNSGAAGTVSIASDMEWEISGGCDWLEFTPAADSGSVDVLFTALSENTQFESRSCTLTVTASNNAQVSFVVTQRGQEPYLEAEVTDPVSGTMGLLYHENSSCNIDIHSNTQWTITSDADWVGFSQTTGEGSVSLTATALTENLTCVPRYATLTVTNGYGQSVAMQVMQYNFYHGVFSISPTSLTIDNSLDATALLTVTATDNWNVVSSPSWLDVTPTEGNSEDYIVTLRVTGNNVSTSPRSGVVVISDVCGRTDSEVSITVTQPAAYLSLSEEEVSLGQPQGSSATVSLECSGNWRANATTIPDWLSVSPSTGSGNASVTLSALSENTEAEPRTAVVKFVHTTSANANLMVTQEAGTGVLEVTEIETNLYPNPVSDMLTLDLEGAFRYTVYDVSGRAVMQGILSASDHTLSVANLEAGVYYIRLTEELTGRTSAKKIVKR